MKTESILVAASLLAVVTGCTTTPVKVSRAPIKADAHFTIPYLEASQVDVPAKATRTVAPRLPMPSSDNDLDEYAIMLFIVDAGGIPREVQWIEASNADIARAAAAAVAEWRFAPAQKGGKAVAMKMQVPLIFHIAATTAPRSRIDDHSYQALPTRYNDNGIFPSSYRHQ